MSKSALQLKIEKRETAESEFQVLLAKGKQESINRAVSKFVSFEDLAINVKRIGIIEPIRYMNTFNRSLKTRDIGKQTIAIAQHLYGKYKVPLYLTRVWNLIYAAVDPTNKVEAWRIQRSGTSNANLRSELELYCSWYSVVGTGGSLWKDFTKGFVQNDGTIRQMFTKKENHTFLNCSIKNASVRQAIIYAIASSYTKDIGAITRICKSKLENIDVGIKVNPVEFYTRPIWREVIHLFAEQEITINELNDLLDYIIHSITQNSEYSLKGRTLISLKKNMKDWHWELNRVKRMGNANWSEQAVPIPNETFTVPNIKDVEWTMEQIVTSKALAAEGTSMHHCVYSYQRRCVDGTCAIWSLKKDVKQKGFVGPTRALTIEMNTTNGSLIQIRGYANRAPRDDEKAAIRFWANKHNFKMF